MALQNPLIPAPANQPNDNQPVPAAGLTTADLARLRHSLDSSVSDNTRAMYNSTWRGFEAWTQARGALAMPVSPPLVAAYLAHLAEERRLSVASVRLHKAALVAVHKAAGHPDPTDNEAVRQIMKGIARAHGKGQKQAKPLTAEALAAVKATAKSRRPLENGKRQESAERAAWRGRVDVALLATLRDGLLRRSEAAALTWGDVEFREDDAALITLRRSKTDQESEGVVLYIGTEASQALLAIRPAPELLDPATPVFGMTTRHIGNRVKAAAEAAGLGEGYTGHSGRVGMAQDLVKSGVELPALMTAGRRKSSKIPARYTERQAADRGAVARYYQGGLKVSHRIENGILSEPRISDAINRASANENEELDRQGNHGRD